jgi:hypothetical protein
VDSSRIDIVDESFLEKEVSEHRQRLGANVFVCIWMPCFSFRNDGWHQNIGK